MYNMYFVTLLVFLHVVCDINYFIRTLFSVMSAKLYRQKLKLNDTVTVFGVCTFQDCDFWLKRMRVARLLREIDFARYHFYERTELYSRTMKLGIKFLQANTMTLTLESVPIFVPYKISTKLVYWDDQSLFFEHQVTTLHDDKIRVFLVSRQHAIDGGNDPISKLVEGYLPSNVTPQCPEYIRFWWRSMLVTSAKLRCNKIDK